MPTWLVFVLGVGLGVVGLAFVLLLLSALCFWFSKVREEELEACASDGSYSDARPAAIVRSSR